MPSEKRQRQREMRDVRRQEMLRAKRRKDAVRRAIILAVLGLVAGGLIFASTRADDDQNVATNAGSTTTAKGQSAARAKPVTAGREITGDTPCPPGSGDVERVKKFEKAPPMCIDPTKTYTATFATTEGSVKVTLDSSAPGTVNNFVVLARYKYYDGSSLHRTDPSIAIIQGGAPTTQSASDPGPGYTIPDEGVAATRTYSEGDLVMARTQGPNSGGGQFFFVTGPEASALNGTPDNPSGGTYVTFGKVADGLEVLKKIIKLHKEDPSSGLGGAPKRVVIIKSVKINES
ncbi:MAG TPA: peptidylprolyl isomerase [Acidimicrobiales bacterium]|nr:peptidylprolyl isomerase [Acidimicrobiales bacterium]